MSSFSSKGHKKAKALGELGHRKISLDNAEFAHVSFAESPEILTVVSKCLREEVPESLFEVQFKPAYVFYSAFFDASSVASHS